MSKTYGRWNVCAAALGILLGLSVLSQPWGHAARRGSRDRWEFGPAGLARNIIIMISDGCGYNHVDAASLWETGHTGVQLYECLPVRFAVSTYPANGVGYDPERAWSEFAYVKSGYTDSAAAATAMATGAKTDNGMIGMLPDGSVLLNVVECAESVGKATGLVTSVPISHATPAGFIAHSLSRNDYEAIAQYMIEESAVDVLMGCGHPWYDNSGMPIVQERYQYVGGEETWNGVLDGSLGSDADGDGLADPWVLIDTREAFECLMQGPTPARVIGIPRVYQTLQQRRAGDRSAAPYVVPMNPDVPTLAEMTTVALNVLDDDPDGFFLMVEGGAVDWASHANESGRMIEEQIDFASAVGVVVDWVQAESTWWETLLIVTSDHETGYLLGPGSDPGWQPLVGSGAGHLPDMEWHSTSHTNSLVPLFAKGAGSWAIWHLADEWDPVRGPYVDNTDVGRTLFLATSLRAWLEMPPTPWRRRGAVRPPARQLRSQPWEGARPEPQADRPHVKRRD